MPRLPILISLLLLLSIPTWSQELEKYENAVTLELGGMGLIYSINYERSHHFYNSNMGITGGIGLSSFKRGEEVLISVPNRINIFHQNKRHTIELGAAATPYMYYEKRLGLIDVHNRYYLSILLNLGYSYRLGKGKNFLGLAFTPAIYDGVFFFQPWGAIKFGHKF